MKLNKTTIILLIGVVAIGCQETVTESPEKALANRQLIHTYSDMALENAIISQHTLYPYHFVQNAAELNELGQRYLDVLIRHFTTRPGHLNIRKYQIPTALYEARIEYIHLKIRNAGINTDRISISDDMPGGSGMASESILVILSEENELTPMENKTTF